MLFNARADVALHFIFWIQASFDIDGVQIELIVKTSKIFQEALTLLLLGNYGIEYFENSRSRASDDRGVEVIVIGIKNINISIIVFCGHQVKVFVIILHVPDEFILDVWYNLLVNIIMDIVFDTIGEAHLLEVV